MEAPETKAPAPRRRPRGTALAWESEDLRRLSQVSLMDLAAAREYWLAIAPEGFEDLLDALPEEEPDGAP